MVDMKSWKTLIRRILENWTNINIMRILNVGQHNLMYPRRLGNNKVVMDYRWNVNRYCKEGRPCVALYLGRWQGGMGADQVKLLLSCDGTGEAV